eukprot:m.297149 g.297149  ORF g.297149 m.297149 type:complete len:312 (+) comp27196_c0_seq1:647-1582(+)
MAPSAVGAGGDVAPVGAIMSFLSGVFDSINIVTPVQCIYGSEVVRKEFKTVFILNGVVFLGFTIFYQFVLAPICSAVYLCEVSQSSGYIQCVATSVVTSWWSIAEPADNTAFELDILWTFFFSMPMFLISKILSNFFFQDIADAGYSHTREGHRTRKKDGGAFRDLADMVYDSVLLLMLGIQIFLLSVVPIFGPFISTLFNAWLHALYCFEYTWIHKGWSFSNRIRYFEENWLYFLGFGLPVALLDFAVESKWARVALYQVIFPISMLIALSVKPPKWSSILPARMPICRESQWATEWLLKQMLPKSLVTG